MEAKNYLLILLLITCCQFSFAQIPLDTIYVQNKKPKEDLSTLRYYYFPNLEAYFDTQESVYICKINGKWVNVVKIPDNLRGYSLKNGIYVLLYGYIGDEPYNFIEEHRKKYPADFSSRPKRKVIVNSKQ